jgi:hypothetical protein
MIPEQLLPDEIIVLKQWGDLSHTEREAIADIAPDEESFKLMKLMLLSAQEQKDDVPSVGDRVQAQLKTAWAAGQKTPVIKMRWWRYAVAAAVFIGILFLGIQRIIRNKTTQPVLVVKTDNPVVVPAPVREKKSDTLPGPVPTIIKEKNKILPVPVASNTNRQRQAVKKTNQNSEAPNLQPPKLLTETDVTVSSRVSDHASLLELVTEVY